MSENSFNALSTPTASTSRILAALATPQPSPMEMAHPISYQLLQDARNLKAPDGYNPTTYQETTNNAFKEYFKTSSDLRRWQMDVAEALALGLNCTVIAPTGASKTIPFILALLQPSAGKKMVLILLPLKELQNNQVRCI